ncbi:hypothetical protein QBK99_19170 [Corticibacterium sp. UT-5YL-CI-8]|nr:hypothetical protein [Tianweitania sp. UT-5YL-CI-8]
MEFLVSQAGGHSVKILRGEDRLIGWATGRGAGNSIAMRDLLGFIRAALAHDEQAEVGNEIADAVLAWMVAYDLLDTGNEYGAADVVAVLNDLAPVPEQASVPAWEKIIDDVDYSYPLALAAGLADWAAFEAGQDYTIKIIKKAFAASPRSAS